MSEPLAGVRVVVTREEPGTLAQLLHDRGATVVHVPLIRTVDAPDGGAALAAALERLDRVEWLIVTSRAGALRVGAAARQHPGLRLAAVGTATATELRARAGRDVDVTPPTQTGAALAAALLEHLGDRPTRLLLAQAEWSDPALAERLRAAGHELDTVVAYRTETLAPDVALLADADAVLFASGSSVDAWVSALGTSSPPLPPIAIAIGPTTAAAGERNGLKITATSADHSVKGLVDELERVVAVR